MVQPVLKSMKSAGYIISCQFGLVQYNDDCISRSLMITIAKAALMHNSCVETMASPSSAGK